VAACSSEDDRLSDYDNCRVCCGSKRVHSRARRPRARRFARDPAVPCDEDAYERTFHVAAGAIRLQFHYGAGRAARSTRAFAASGAAEVVQARPAIG